MIITFLILIVLVASVWIFMRQPSFGQASVGDRLARIRQSPNFREGQFQNLSPTPSLTEGATYPQVMRQFFFGRNPRRYPSEAMPSTKTDLHALDPKQNILVWFGHSSYFLQIDGKKILVDPVFSGAASPFNFANRSFPGSDVYGPADFPPLDVLFISHDHWDHLDYATVTALRPKVGQIITGLGTGAHLERWGFLPDQIIEKDWHEQVDLGVGFQVNVLPARHFSGRGFRRNRALWVSFALKTPSLNLFLGGDSGYDTHFRSIGQQFGPFDLAILECGQYNRFWKYIHTTPEEAVQAALDLRARCLLPVHWGKFAMAMHDWDEPPHRVMAAAEKAKMPLMTPLIGEVAPLS